MNLSINAATPNYNMNCKNNSPNFGMSVLVDKKAIPVIKEQALKLSQKVGKDGSSKYDAFWTKLNEIIDRQKDNPVNIIIGKVFGRKKLKATVVDSVAETAVKNQKSSQGMFSRTGNLSFLEKAEAEANKMNDANLKVADFEIAEKANYRPPVGE